MKIYNRRLFNIAIFFLVLAMFLSVLWYSQIIKIFHASDSERHLVEIEHEATMYAVGIAYLIGNILCYIAKQPKK